MKKFFTLCTTICCVIFLLYNSKVKGQAPVETNGRFEKIQGVKIYYEETGTGMPLVLVHGFGRITSDWDTFIPELSKEHRVIAVDLPGHGRSDYIDTTDVYLHKTAATYIIGLLDALHFDSVNVMGASSGAMIALYIATMRPLLAKRIIVIDGQNYYSNTTRKVIASLGGPENPVMSMEVLSKMHGKQKGALIARQFWNFRNLYGDPSFTPDVLSTIKAKTLIIHGDNDPVAPASNAWEMFQNIPNAHLWIVPNGGHVPIAIRSNQDDFMRRVTEFLRGDWERR